MNRYGKSKTRYPSTTIQGGKKNGTAWPSGETGPNPNDLIDTIVDAIDYAELASDAQGLIKARRLLNNDLRQAIDVYIQDEIVKELHRRRGSRSSSQESERYASHPG